MNLVLIRNFRSVSSDGTDHQITQISDCGLKRIGDLDFNMYYGSCFSTNKEMVLCFGQNDGQQCRIGSDPTGEFIKIAKSKFYHQSISLTASKGKGF